MNLSENVPNFVAPAWHKHSTKKVAPYGILPSRSALLPEYISFIAPLIGKSWAADAVIFLHGCVLFSFDYSSSHPSFKVMND